MPDEFHLCAQRILEAAVQLAPEERDAFLQRQCADDLALLSEVRSLLPHYQQMCDYEPERGPEWFLPGTTTIARAHEDAATELEAEDPLPPFCIDQYRCEEVLGRGGMGIVYRATHATLKRPFAIKLLRRGLFSSEDRWRFAFETEILRRLQHPGIARIFHANEVKSTSGTQPYFIMEYILGKSLVQYAETTGLNPLQRLALFANVCEPIEFAHRRGIVHRDLKPGNILVDGSGQPKILDFGIARIEDLAPSSANDDRDGFIGTREYASPEQIAGKNDAVAPSSDVYSLGLILHELLTGRLPATVDGKLRLDLNRIRLDGKSRGRGARQKEFRYFLHVILSAALARSPAKRYRSAGELGSAVTAVATEFDRPSGWSAIRTRLTRLLSGKSPAPDDRQNRPLAAVLRTRIAMFLDVERPRVSSAGQPPRSASDDDSDDDVYRVRETEQ
jgi:serine/threonine protein kinase